MKEDFEDFYKSVGKKTMLFLIVMAFFPLAALFGWVFWLSCSDKRTDGEIILDMAKEIQCIGRVNSIYRQKMNHNVLVLETNICLFEVWPQWENKFNVGDSISKVKGEIIVKHYRGGKLLELLDYHEIAKDIK